jgi:hypothetical protein
MPGIAVQWFEEGGNWWTASDVEGRFTLKRIIGGPGKLYLGFGGVNVEAYAGSPPAGDMRIVLPLATLRGRVVQADGDPGRALVMASPVRSHNFRVEGFMGGDPQPPVSTKRDGSFEMRLAAGIWHVRAYGEGSALNPKPVEVDLPAAGTVVDMVVTLVPAK